MSVPASSARRAGFDWLTLWSAVVTFMITVNLVFRNAEVVVGGGQVGPSLLAIVEYWVAAGFMIALQVALLVRAILSRHAALAFIATIASVLAVGAALVLSIPPIDWYPNAPIPTNQQEHHACYTGSNDCVGA